jgi:hypothetical protein
MTLVAIVATIVTIRRSTPAPSTVEVRFGLPRPDDAQVSPDGTEIAHSAIVDGARAGSPSLASGTTSRSRESIGPPTTCSGQPTAGDRVSGGTETETD